MKATLIFGVLAALAIAGCGGGGDEGAPSAGNDAASAEVPFDTSGWSTDFSKHEVSLDEFVSGGPGKDGIPAVDDPRFVDVGAAGEFLDDREPVAIVALDGETKAYPIRIMVWHEIVNDELAGRPIAVTYCPLCNSTVAFSREVEGRTLDFGTTGNLRQSDLVMYDRQTESWWQQITAEAVVGELSGKTLEVLPSQILSWGKFKRLHDDGRVLSTETGYSRPYGENPYQGYDDPSSAPFALRGEPDRRLPPKERVAAVKTGEGAAVVYPFSRLQSDTPINDSLPERAVVGGKPVVVFFDPDVASPLDTEQVSAGKEAGAAAIFERAVGGKMLSFERAGAPGTFRDRQTRSTWDMSGRASAGPLKGKALRQVPSDDQFWFALAAFFPRAEIRG